MILKVIRSLSVVSTLLVHLSQVTVIAAWIGSVSASARVSNLFFFSLIGF